VVFLAGAFLAAFFFAGIAISFLFEDNGEPFKRAILKTGFLNFKQAC
jgi:hypothetical protein